MTNRGKCLEEGHGLAGTRGAVGDAWGTETAGDAMGTSALSNERPRRDPELVLTGTAAERRRWRCRRTSAWPATMEVPPPPHLSGSFGRDCSCVWVN